MARVADSEDRQPRKPKVHTITMRYIKRNAAGEWVEISNNRVR